VILTLGPEAIGDAELGDVIAACERRGIGAVCLDVQDVAELQRAGGELRRHGIMLSAFRITSVDDVAPDAAARVSAALRCALLRDANTPRPWVAAFVAAGGTIVDAVELDPRLHNVADQLLAVTATNGLPTHITLRGGGPEAVQFEGRGIGSLMTQLSVAGYRGFLILAPSGRGTRQLWKTWLFSRRNWGCGSKTSDPSLVEIQ
jgi:hypothetical protein